MKFVRYKGKCNCGCNDTIFKDVFSNSTVRYFYEKIGWFQSFSHCLECDLSLEISWESS